MPNQHIPQLILVYLWCVREDDGYVRIYYLAQSIHSGRKCDVVHIHTKRNTEDRWRLHAHLPTRVCVCDILTGCGGGWENLSVANQPRQNKTNNCNRNGETGCTLSIHKSNPVSNVVVHLEVLQSRTGSVNSPNSWKTKDHIHDKLTNGL